MDTGDKKRVGAVVSRVKSNINGGYGSFETLAELMDSAPQLHRGTLLMAYRGIGKNRSGKGKLQVLSKKEATDDLRKLVQAAGFKTTGVCPALGENRGRHKNGSGRVIRLGNSESR